MLRDRYDSDKLFEQITALMPKMDPVLAKIDAYLEDEELFTLIREDLSRRHPQTLVTGRNSTPVEVILRMLVVKRLYSYSYEETERYVKDSLVLRQFCRLYLNPVPDDTTLIRQANLIRPETLEKFNARITEPAQAAKITTGRKLRTDGTVVETNIHAPSDNQLLADGVRVLARTVKRARAACHRVAEVLGETFTNSTRAAKQKSREIGKTLRQGGEEAKKAVETAYRELVEMTQKTVAQAQQALALLANETDDQARRLAETLQTFLPRVEQVIRQTERRIFGQENVPAREKLVSLFEVHTDIIVRGKEGRPVEYGHKVWLDEVDGGIVSHYRILQGNPADSTQPTGPSAAIWLSS